MTMMTIIIQYIKSIIHYNNDNNHDNKYEYLDFMSQLIILINLMCQLDIIIYTR